MSFPKSKSRNNHFIPTLIISMLRFVKHYGNWEKGGFRIIVTKRDKFPTIYIHGHTLGIFHKNICGVLLSWKLEGRSTNTVCNPAFP